MRRTTAMTMVKIITVLQDFDVVLFGDSPTRLGSQPSGGKTVLDKS